MARARHGAFAPSDAGRHWLALAHPAADAPVASPPPASGAPGLEPRWLARREFLPSQADG